jgi:MFS family permease
LAGRIFYGWYIVGISFFCLTIVSGVGLLSFPVFVAPLEREFPWSRTAILGGVAAAAVAAGICLPLIGYCIDKIGVRRVMVTGIFLAGSSFLLLSMMNSILTWYLSLLLAGLGIAASTYIPVASLVTRWFFKRRGLAMSLAMAGMGVGGFLMPNLAAFIIETAGWRQAYRISGFITLILLFPLAGLVVRGDPADIGTKAFGDEGNKSDLILLSRGPLAHDGQNSHLTARAALGTRNFWSIGIAEFCNAFGVVGLGANLVAFAVEAGVTPRIAALGYSFINAVTLAGIVAVGAAADRFNHRVMITLSYLAPAVGILFLFNLKDTFFLFLFAAIAGVSSAGRITLWPLVVNETFGKEAYATVMGFLIIFYTVGIAAAPPITGLIYDTTGAYTGIFILSIIAFVLSGVQIAAGAKTRKGSNQR